MPTPLDKALQSRASFFAFAGTITAAAAWMIWGTDMFPAQPDPTGDPQAWTTDELRCWLNKRNLVASDSASRDELLERVQIYMGTPPR